MTCQAECDAHPASGALPAACPAACEDFRRQPDALERAAELDAQYGSNPDLDAMPMYCVAFSFKDVFDTSDMRSTGGADVSYAMDAAPEDSTIVGELREKGAIIYAKANLAEYNGGSGNPGGARSHDARRSGPATAARGAASPATPTITALRDRRIELGLRRRRSARTSRRARSARRPAARAASRRGATASSGS